MNTRGAMASETEINKKTSRDPLLENEMQKGTYLLMVISIIVIDLDIKLKNVEAE